LEEGDPAESDRVHTEEVLTQEMHHVDLRREKKYRELIYKTTSIKKQTHGRWEDNIKQDLKNRREGAAWIHLTQDSCQAFVNTAMNLRDP
jgi:hypothetical protein